MGAAICISVPPTSNSGDLVLPVSPRDLRQQDTDIDRSIPELTFRTDRIFVMTESNQQETTVMLLFVQKQ